MPNPLSIRKLKRASLLDENNIVLRDNIRLWLRDDSGIVLDETGTPSVTQWQDRSPNEVYVYQESKSSQPVLTSDGVTFDGVNDLMIFTSPLIRHFFAVFRNKNPVFDNNYGGIVNTTTTATNTRLAIFEANQTRLHGNIFPASVRKNGIQLPSPFNLAPVDTPMVVSIVTAATASNGTYRLAGMGTTTHSAISIRELICYTSQLSESEVAAIEAYLMRRYSIS